MEPVQANFIIQVILDLALCYSPNLKEIVCFWRAIPDFRFLPERERERERELIHLSPWSELPLEYAFPQTPGTKKCRLTSLTVGERSGLMDPNERCDMGLLGYVIKAWSKRVAFGTLQRLKLGSQVTLDAMNRLIAKAPRFLSLSALSIHASLQLDVFLLALRPLVELEIHGDIGLVNPSAVLERHGQTLRRLSLLGIERVFPPYIHEPASLVCCSEVTKELRLRCPVLEELTMLARRSQGDSEELAIYHELGSHPSLQKIHLTLECSVDVLGEVTFEDAFAQQPFQWPGRDQTEIRNGHIIESLVNCGIDQRVVAVIFSSIAAAKPPNSKPLERLTIQTSNAGKFVDSRRQVVTVHRPSLPVDEHMYLREPIFDHFTRKWIAVPNHDVDCQYGVIVKEDLEAFASQHVKGRDWYDQNGKLMLGSVEPHYRAMWPEEFTAPRSDDNKNGAGL